jgi:hypothetical protein
MGLICTTVRLQHHGGSPRAVSVDQERRQPTNDLDRASVEGPSGGAADYVGAMSEAHDVIRAVGQEGERGGGWRPYTWRLEGSGRVRPRRRDHGDARWGAVAVVMATPRLRTMRTSRQTAELESCRVPAGRGPHESGRHRLVPKT